MIDSQKICVVIPAYRAETTILPVLEGLPDFIDCIIVVDDRSPDRTAELVEKYQKKHPKVTLLRHERNLGVGGAMLTGYQEAARLQASVVVKMDSDGQMDPIHLPALVQPILAQQVDYSKGNRFYHARDLLRMPIVRRLGNLGLSFLTKAASGYWNIFDPTNGYTAIRGSLLPTLDTAQLHPRYYFEISMLQELGRHRYLVADVFMPARYENQVSSLSTWRSLVEFPGLLIKGMARRIYLTYFVMDFTATSLFLVSGLISLLFGTAWGAYHWQRSDQTGFPATTGTVMIAVLPFIIGLQLLLQAIVLDIQSSPSRADRSQPPHF